MRYLIFFSLRLAIFGRTRKKCHSIWQWGPKTWVWGRALFLRAQPIADKEKSPWNRLGSRPSAASVETSISPVQEETVSRRSLSRPTFLLNVNVGRPGKENRSFFFLTYFLTNSCLMDSLEKVLCFSHRGTTNHLNSIVSTWHNKVKEHKSLPRCPPHIKCLALPPFK